MEGSAGLRPALAWRQNDRSTKSSCLRSLGLCTAQSAITTLLLNGKVMLKSAWGMSEAAKQVWCNEARTCTPLGLQITLELWIWVGYQQSGQGAAGL